MEIRSEAVGETAGHVGQASRVVHAFALDTGCGLAITVLTYGATLVRVAVPDRYERTENVVRRLAGLSDYDREDGNYVGATVGRYARVIADSRMLLDGVEYRVAPNVGRHHFHGGSIGFDRYVWDASHAVHPDELALHLRLESPHGDQGYPGTLSAETIYTVDRTGRLTFEHKATTTASTVVALTNHAYWNLSGSGGVNDHVLTLNAPRVLTTDAELIPVGSPVMVSGTALDYTTPRRIGDDRLDHCFTLDDPSWAAELLDPNSGRAMRVTTNQPGLAVYTGDGLGRPRSGLSLQTGAWPDAPNRSDYPSPRLDPGSTYYHRTCHEFSSRQ